MAEASGVNQDAVEVVGVDFTVEATYEFPDGMSITEAQATTAIAGANGVSESMVSVTVAAARRLTAGRRLAGVRVDAQILTDDVALASSATISSADTAALSQRLSTITGIRMVSCTIVAAPVVAVNVQTNMISSSTTPIEPPTPTDVANSLSSHMGQAVQVQIEVLTPSPTANPTLNPTTEPTAVSTVLLTLRATSAAPNPATSAAPNPATSAAPNPATSAAPTPASGSPTATEDESWVVIGVETATLSQPAEESGTESSAASIGIFVVVSIAVGLITLMLLVFCWRRGEAVKKNDLEHNLEHVQSHDEQIVARAMEEQAVDLNAVVVSARIVDLNAVVVSAAMREMAAEDADEAPWLACDSMPVMTSFDPQDEGLWAASTPHKGARSAPHSRIEDLDPDPKWVQPRLSSASSTAPRSPTEFGQLPPQLSAGRHDEFPAVPPSRKPSVIAVRAVNRTTAQFVGGPVPVNPVESYEDDFDTSNVY